MNFAKLLCAAVVFALAVVADAAPKARGEVPVVAGFPVWEGVSDANYVAGRRLCPSDLRDKVVVVVEFDAAEAAKQLKSCLPLTGRVRFDGIQDYHSFRMPADLIVVCSNRGARNDDKVLDAIKRNDAAAGMKVNGTPIYNSLVLKGGPDAGGKYPFFYVLGPKGGEPLLKGEVNAKNVAEAGKVIKEATKGLAEWKPFVGRSPETKTAAAVAKLAAAGKPLAATYKGLVSAMKAKGGAAEEAQRAYDALERTRSDLKHRLAGESKKSPACAFRDYDLLVKCWPEEKARLGEALKAMSAFKEGPALGRYAARLLWLSEGSPTEAERKKAAGELKKMKADLDKMKESQNVLVQNDAHALSRLLDEVSGGR